MPDSEVMTIDELAGYLKIAKSTLYKLAQEGKVPGQKVGKHWRFRRSTINEWLSSTARGDTPSRLSDQPLDDGQNAGGTPDGCL